MYFDLKRISKPYILVQSKQHHYLIDHDVTTFKELDPLYPASHLSCCAQALHRLEKLLLLILLRFQLLVIQNTELIRWTLIYYSTIQCKLPNRPRRLFYPMALLWLIYLLFKLLNKPDRLLPSGTFTVCYTSYQIGQTDPHLLTFLQLAL